MFERDQEAWLQPFQGYTHFLKPLFPAEFSVGGSDDEERQTIFLFRGVFELSNGRVDQGQHIYGLDYTTSHNMYLCAYVLGIDHRHRLGHFDPQAMQGVLNRSSLYRASDHCLSAVDWSVRMMKYVPLGFPRDYMVPHHRDLYSLYLCLLMITASSIENTSWFWRTED